MCVFVTGWITALVCFLLLFCYHASRDALITALPTIAYPSEDNDTVTNAGDALIFRPTEAAIADVHEIAKALSLNESSTNINQLEHLDYNKIADVILAYQAPLSQLDTSERHFVGENDPKYISSEYEKLQNDIGIEPEMIHLKAPMQIVNAVREMIKNGKLNVPILHYDSSNQVLDDVSISM